MLVVLTAGTDNTCTLATKHGNTDGLRCIVMSFHHNSDDGKAVKNLFLWKFEHDHHKIASWNIKIHLVTCNMQVTDW